MIEIVEGKIVMVEFVVKLCDVKFEIRIVGEKGIICVDGVDKGIGVFFGEFSSGKYVVWVVCNGYDLFVKIFDFEFG